MLDAIRMFERWHPDESVPVRPGAWRALLPYQLRLRALVPPSHPYVMLARPSGDSAKTKRGNALVQQIVAETGFSSPFFCQFVRSGPSQARARSSVRRPGERPEGRPPASFSALPALAGVAESRRPTRRRFPLMLFSASKAPHLRKPMKAYPNTPSRNHAGSRTTALELGGFSRDPMRRAAAQTPGSTSPLRRLSVAISLGIAAQHPAGVLVRSDLWMPSGTSTKRLAVKRRANREFVSAEPPLASFSS